MIKKTLVCFMGLFLLTSGCLMVRATDNYDDSPIALQDFIDQTTIPETDDIKDEEDITVPEIQTESDVLSEADISDTDEFNTNEPVVENDPSDFLCVVNDGETHIKSYTGSSENVIIPSEIDGGTVTTIDEKAFSSNKNIHSVTIPNTVTSIGEKAFEVCTSLEKVTFPSDTDYLSIGDYAFSQSGLNGEVIIDSPNVSIGAYAFAYTNIAEFIILSDDITFSDAPFSYNNRLEVIYIKPDANTVYSGIFANSKVGDVFANLDSLKELYLPVNCGFLTENTFEGTPGVVVYVPEESSIVDYVTSLWIPVNTTDYEKKASEILGEVSQKKDDISDGVQSISETVEADQGNKTVEESESELETETETEMMTEEAQTQEDKSLIAPDKDISGIIIEATMNSITIQTDDGKTYSCSTENAEFDLTDGITLGLAVEVTLENEISNEYGNFEAAKVAELSNGNTVHLESVYEDETEAGALETIIEGTIVEATMNTITVQDDNGNEYICATEDAEIDVLYGIILGLRVKVTLEDPYSNEYGIFNALQIVEISEDETETGTEVATEAEIDTEIEEEAEGGAETETETEIETEAIKETEAGINIEAEVETEKESETEIEKETETTSEDSNMDSPIEITTEYGNYFIKVVDAHVIDWETFAEEGMKYVSVQCEVENIDYYNGDSSYAKDLRCYDVAKTGLQLLDEEGFAMKFADVKGGSFADGIYAVGAEIPRSTKKRVSLPFYVPEDCTKVTVVINDDYLMEFTLGDY